MTHNLLFVVQELKRSCTIGKLIIDETLPIKKIRMKRILLSTRGLQMQCEDIIRARKMIAEVWLKRSSRDSRNTEDDSSKLIDLALVGLQ
jgi:hypothetical protein